MFYTQIRGGKPKINSHSFISLCKKCQIMPKDRQKSIATIRVTQTFIDAYRALVLGPLISKTQVQAMNQSVQSIRERKCYYRLCYYIGNVFPIALMICAVPKAIVAFSMVYQALLLPGAFSVYVNAGLFHSRHCDSS